jgi:hypothetical protein
MFAGRFPTRVALQTGIGWKAIGATRLLQPLGPELRGSTALRRGFGLRIHPNRRGL